MRRSWGGAAMLAALMGLLLALLLIGPGTPGSAADVMVPSWAPGDPTTATLSVASPAVARGTAATLTGQLLDPATGAGVPDAAVDLEAQSPDGAWQAVAALVTDAAGAVAAAAGPVSTTLYRLHHGEPGSLEESASPAVQVTVLPLVAAWDRSAVRLGRAAVVIGASAADGPRVVRLERRARGSWVPAGRTTVDAAGTFRFLVTPTEAGFVRFRVLGRGQPAVPQLGALDVYRLHTYSVATRGHVGAGLAVFRSTVAATYADPRGWSRAHHRFREVGRGGDLTVVLSEARWMPSFSSECSPSYSCREGRYVVINERGWRLGSPSFPADLSTFRQMVIDHETGHWLGLGHALCPRPGAPAPVMQQQSKGMHGCRPNPWPLPREVRAVS